MMQVTVHGVPSGEAEAWWPVLLPYLEGFAERSRGRWSVHGLVADIRERERQVWIAGTTEALLMVGLTRVVTDQRGDTAVYIDAAAGADHVSWFDAFDHAIREWAKSQGAERVFCLARPGYDRLAKAAGWREIHREYVLELT